LQRGTSASARVKPEVGAAEHQNAAQHTRAESQGSLTHSLEEEGFEPSVPDQGGLCCHALPLGCL
jgi:hypothetical protein